MISHIDWLLGGPPWVKYRTLIDLLGQSEDAPEVQEARKEMLVHPQVRALLADLADWPGPALKSHKSAGQLLHKLRFIADLGLQSEDAGIAQVISRITAHQSSEGPFQVVANINPKYGGTGVDQFTWMLCDAPLVLYALSKFGLGGSPEVRAAVNFLVGLARDNGWPCACDPALGKFRGPGRKSDPCPYANLLMLKLLTLFPDLHDDRRVQTGVETLLSLWEQRRERRPYLFAMGTGFAKLKAPLIWYDILNVADALTQFQWTLEDSRLREMIALIERKAEDGRFTAESVWRDWKEWDFGQKREPSRWITLVANRILRRAGVSVGGTPAA